MISGVIGVTFVTKISSLSQMPKSANTKKYDHKPSGKWQPVKQEKLLKDVKVKHAPPVSSKDIIAKAGANVRVICGLLLFPANRPPLHRLPNPKNRSLHRSQL